MNTNAWKKNWQMSKKIWPSCTNERKALPKKKKQTKQQKEEAEKYNRYLEHIEQLKVQRALWKLYFLEHDINAGERELADLRKQVSEYEQQKHDKDNLLKEAQKSQAAKKKQVNNAERSLQKGTRDYQDSCAELGKAEAELKSQTESIKRLQDSLKKVTKTAEDQKKDMKKLEKEIQEKKRELGAVETEHASALRAATGLQITPEQRQKYSDLSSKARQKTVELRAEYDDIKRTYDSSSKEVSDLETQQKDLESRKEEATTDKDSAEKRLESLQQTRKEEKEGLDSDLQESKQLRSELESDKKRQKELAAELEEVQGSLADAKDARQKSNSEKQILNAVEDMQRLFSGVYGRMLDLCTPVSSKYHLAVDVAFGRYVDAVVVDTTTTAKECINYLRQHQMKPQYFFPLDSLRISHPEESLINEMVGPYKLLRDVIRCDKEIEDAVAFVCGRTVIAETLYDATKFRFDKQIQAKVITVDGAVVAKNGSMTGGMSQEETSRAKRWSEKEMEAIHQKRDKLLNEEEKLRRRIASSGMTSESLPKKISDIENRISERRHKIGVLDDDIKQEQESIKARNRELQEINKQLKSTNQKHSKAKKALDQSEEKLNKKQSDIDSIKEEVFSDFCKELNIESISEYENTVMSKESQFKSRTRGLEDTIKVLENKLEYEESRKLDDNVAKIEKQIDDAESGKDKLEQKVQTCKDNVESAKMKQHELEERVSELKEELKDEEEEVSALKQAKEAANKKVSDVQRKVTTQETFLERKRADRHQMLTDARMDQVELPLLNQGDEGSEDKSGKKGKQTRHSSNEDDTTITSEGDTRGDENATASTRSAQLLSESSQRFSQSDGAAVRRDSERVAEIDFSAMEVHITNPERMSKSEIEKKTSEYDDKISSTQMEVEQMRPNLKAVEQFEEISERLERVGEDLEKSRQKVRELNKEFSQIKERRTHMFMSAFRFVAKRIDSIYKELTRSRRNTMGGKARLDLANEEEPFSSEGIRYHAMPPMKKFRDMDQLSGGEKTVAALALMFAIHEFQPAPFFIMDEIDAALDNANVARVSNYLRRRAAASGKSRQISDRASLSSGDSSKGGERQERRKNREKPLQFVVISLKDAFYSKAHSLIGVYRDNAHCCSGTLTLDLSPYGNENQEAPDTPDTYSPKQNTPARDGTPQASSRGYHSRRNLAQELTTS
eukprot:gb/GECG01004586.1/.p1 GENE.gb/GECG01004586.1/~~gb/GECG01004586.1/.p1  ORF type:complete len:1187 (+),score=248.19 gb/GECG01004586.1/:1-3561(+)